MVLKDIKCDTGMWLKTQRKPQSTQADPNFRPGSKHGGGGPGYGQGSLGSIHSRDGAAYAHLHGGALWHSDRPTMKTKREKQNEQEKKTQPDPPGPVGLSKVGIDLGTSHFLVEFDFDTQGRTYRPGGVPQIHVPFPLFLQSSRMSHRPRWSVRGSADSGRWASSTIVTELVSSDTKKCRQFDGISEAPTFFCRHLQFVRRDLPAL